MSTEICPECKYEPREYNLPGVPVRRPGTPHHSSCPTIPRLSPEARARVEAKIAEIERARRRAMAEAHLYVIA